MSRATRSCKLKKIKHFKLFSYVFKWIRKCTVIKSKTIVGSKNPYQDKNPTQLKHYILSLANITINNLWPYWQRKVNGKNSHQRTRRWKIKSWRLNLDFSRRMSKANCSSWSLCSTVCSAREHNASLQLHFKTKNIVVSVEFKRHFLYHKKYKNVFLFICSFVCSKLPWKRNMWFFTIVSKET